MKRFALISIMQFAAATKLTLVLNIHPEEKRPRKSVTKGKPDT
jgi:hypothetical protein